MARDDSTAATAGSKPDQIAGRHNLSKAQLRALQRASDTPRRIVISRQVTSAAVADSLVQIGLWSKFFESYPNTSRSLPRYAFTDAGILALLSSDQPPPQSPFRVWLSVDGARNHNDPSGVTISFRDRTTDPATIRQVQISVMEMLALHGSLGRMLENAASEGSRS